MIISIYINNINSEKENLVMMEMTTDFSFIGYGQDESIIFEVDDESFSGEREIKLLNDLMGIEATFSFNEITSPSVNEELLRNKPKGLLWKFLYNTSMSKYPGSFKKGQWIKRIDGNRDVIYCKFLELKHDAIRASEFVRVRNNILDAHHKEEHSGPIYFNCQQEGSSKWMFISEIDEYFLKLEIEKALQRNGGKQQWHYAF